MQSRAASRMTRRRAASRSKDFFCIFLNRYILYIICNTVTKRRNALRAVFAHSLASVVALARQQFDCEETNDEEEDLCRIHWGSVVIKFAWLQQWQRSGRGPASTTGGRSRAGH